MGRKKIHADHAARQRAYRQRVKDRVSETVPLAAGSTPDESLPESGHTRPDSSDPTLGSGTSPVASGHVQTPHPDRHFPADEEPPSTAESTPEQVLADLEGRTRVSHSGPTAVEAYAKAWRRRRAKEEAKAQEPPVLEPVYISGVGWVTPVPEPPE